MSTYVLLHRAKLMETPNHEKIGKVHVYIQQIRKADGLAYSMWLPWKNIVVLDARMLLDYSNNQINFIVAHEIGHLVLGHCRRSFWRVATGRMMLFVENESERARDEIEADNFARGVTGYDMATHQENLA
jgi:Zn-dependent peptidase ImmA (M78 family)